MLHADRAVLRAELEGAEMRGLIGNISCDAFGDCGTGRVNTYHHTDSGVADIASLPIVYQCMPATTGTGTS